MEPQHLRPVHIEPPHLELPQLVPRNKGTPHSVPPRLRSPACNKGPLNCGTCITIPWPRRAEPAQTVLGTPYRLGAVKTRSLRRAEPAQTVMTRSPDVRSPFKRSWQHPIDDPRPPRAEPVRRSWDHLIDLETVMTPSSDVLSRFYR